MLYYKKSNTTFNDIKSLASAIPGIGNHIYDSADPNTRFDEKVLDFYFDM